MPGQDLSNYIKAAIEKGSDIQTITSALLKKGWNQIQIDSAFASLQSGSTKTSSLPLAQETQNQSNYLPGFKELLSEAWQTYKQRWKTLAAITILPFIFLIPIVIGLLLIYQNLGKMNMDMPILILFIVLMTIGLGGLVLLNLWSPVAFLFAIKDRNEKTGLKTSFGRSRGKVLSIILLSLFTSIITALGFIFMIVLIFLAMSSLSRFCASILRLCSEFQLFNRPLLFKFLRNLRKTVGIMI